MKPREFSENLDSIASKVDRENNLTALSYTHGFLTALLLIVQDKMNKAVSLSIIEDAQNSFRSLGRLREAQKETKEARKETKEALKKLAEAREEIGGLVNPEEAQKENKETPITADQCDHLYYFAENFEDIGVCKETGVSFVSVGALICKKCEDRFSCVPTESVQSDAKE